MALSIGNENRVAGIASTDQIRMTGDGANLWRVERRGTGMNLVWYENNVFRSNRPITGITITANDKIVSVCNENASNLFIAIYFTTGTARTEIWRVPKVTSGNAVATRLSQAVTCARRNEMGADFDGQKWVGNHLGVIKRVDNITTSTPTACNFNNTIGGNTFSNTALPVGSAEVVDASDDKLLILRQDGNLYEVTPNTTTSGTTITATLVGSVGTGTVEGLAATNVSSTSKNLYYTRSSVLYRRVLTHAAAPAAPTAVAGTLNINDKSLSLQAGASGTVTLEAATGGTGTVAYALVGPPTGLSLGVTNRVLTVGSAYPAGTRNITVRATWTSGSTTASTTDVFALAVTRTPNAVAGTFAPTAVVASGEPNTQLTTTFTAATGGTGTVSYAIVNNGGATLSVSGTTLTVGATQAAGTFRIAVRARWTSGTSTADRTAFFNLTVTRQTGAPPAAAGTFSPATVNVTLDANTAGTATFDAATGGTGAITYALGAAGGSNATIAGTTINIPAATAAGTYRLGIQATWTSGSTTASRIAFFNMVLTRRAATPNAVAGTFSPSDITGAEIGIDREGRLAFDGATGGTGTISYTLLVNGGVTGLAVDGNILIVPSDTIAGTYRVAVRARWTSGSTTADRTAFFNFTFARVMLAGDVPRAMGQRTIQWLAENDLRQDHNREIDYHKGK